MPQQPDFEVTAFIPTDRQQRHGEIPDWSDLVVDVEREGSGRRERLHLTRAAGEVLLDTVNTALHPRAGGSIRQMLWDDLDALMDIIMDDDEPDDPEIRGKAAGVARALALITTPYDPDIDAIREEAVERWENR